MSEQRGNEEQERKEDEETHMGVSTLATEGMDRNSWGGKRGGFRGRGRGRRFVKQDCSNGDDDRAPEKWSGLRGGRGGRGRRGGLRQGGDNGGRGIFERGEAKDPEKEETEGERAPVKYVPPITFDSPEMPSKENRQTVMCKTDNLLLGVGAVGAACSDVEQTVIQVTKYDKREQLLGILKTTGTERTIVFVEEKRVADFIACYMCLMKVKTTSIHSDREKPEREKALADFRFGECPVLVATPIAVQDLDIPDVQHVVNFELPNNIDEYVRRIGRTGRCGNTGKAVSFYDPDADCQLARSLVRFLSKTQQELPVWLVDSAFSSNGAVDFNPFMVVSCRNRT